MKGMSGIGQATAIAGQGLMQYGQMLFQKEMKAEDHAKAMALVDKKSKSLASTKANFSQTKEGMQYAHDLKMTEQAAGAYREIDERYETAVNKIRQSADLGPEDKNEQIAALKQQYESSLDRYQKRYKGNDQTKGHIEAPFEAHNGQFATADEYISWAKQQSPGKTDQQLIDYAKQRGITISNWQQYSEIEPDSTGLTGKPGNEEIQNLASAIPKPQEKNGSGHVVSAKGGRMGRAREFSKARNNQTQQVDSVDSLISKRQEMIKAISSRSIPSSAKAGIRRKLRQLNERLAALGVDANGNQIASN